MRTFMGLAGLTGVFWRAREARARRGVALCASLGLLVACAPALDWREVRPADSAVRVLFPCKPVTQVRRVLLAGQEVRLALHACSAGGQTWALAHADVGDPARRGPALTELLASAATNLGATAGPGQALQVKGATPHEASQRQRIAGQLPDGTAVVEEVAVFTYGTRVYQATALGPSLQTQDAQTFIDSLRAGS